MTSALEVAPEAAAKITVLPGSDRVRRWPLFLIASPAAVAIWSGWVGLGGLCGFGPIHPLPGIDSGLTINTAITLPIGVEAYGAYALRVWLAGGASDRAQRFARRSALGALALGMCGQVIYHLLAAAHAARAPWPVTMLVSCIPVITLGFGAALTHLLKGDVTDEAMPAGSDGQHDMPSTVPEGGDAGAGVRADVADVPAARTEIQREAPQDARTASQPGPADRDAVIAAIAEEIRDAIEAGELWRPDYPALMERTGRRRSWCEKAVRDARMMLLDSPADRTDDAASPRTDDGAPRARTEPAGAAGEPRTDDDPDGADDRTGQLVLAGAP
jgi:hypothetical protein